MVITTEASLSCNRFSELPQMKENEANGWNISAGVNNVYPCPVAVVQLDAAMQVVHERLPL